MQKLTILLFFYSSIACAAQIDFLSAQKLVLEHDVIKNSRHQAMAQEQAAEVAGAWGDPMVSVGAANLPIDKNFRRDVTPMSGIVFGVAQKIPLGARAAKKEDAGRAKAKQLFAQTEFASQRLLANFWNLLINLKRHSSDLNFLKENEMWLKSMVQVSKKLYSNGKVTQQALLDIQIRYNQVKASIAEKVGIIAQLNSNISYLLGEPKIVQVSNVPWSKLEKVKDKEDLQEKSFNAAVQAAELERSAARWARLPDATIGVNYIKRSNIDGNGDFVGLTISMPLPFGTTRSSSESMASEQWLSAKSGLLNYKQQRESTLYSLSQEASALEQQFNLTNKSLSFARTAREVSSKSYRIGGLSYFDLLQAELRLQEIEFKSNELSAKIADNLIQQKLWHSDMVIQ